MNRISSHKSWYESRKYKNYSPISSTNLTNCLCKCVDAWVSPVLFWAFKGDLVLAASTSGSTGMRRQRRKGERKNAGRLEPGYSAQLDAAASNWHEQEKSIKPTRLLSRGLLQLESVERIKTVWNKQSSRGQTLVAVCCRLCQFAWHWPQDNFHFLCSSQLFLYSQTVLVSLFFLLFYANNFTPGIFSSYFSRSVRWEKKGRMGKTASYYNEEFLA